MTKIQKLQLENVELRIRNVELQGQMLNRVQADLIQQRKALNDKITKDKSSLVKVKK